MEPNEKIQLAAVVIGFIGTMIALIVNNRKSIFVQEQILEEAKKTNGRLTKVEERQHQHAEDIVGINKDIKHINEKIK